MSIFSKKLAGMAAVLAALAASPTNAAGTLFVGSASDGVNSVSVRDSETLAGSGANRLLADASGGVVAGNDSNLFVTAGDTLSNFDLMGGTISSVAVSGNEFTDATVFAAQLVVAVAGDQQGFSFRDSQTLLENSFIATDFPVDSIHDGFGRLFITSGDTVSTFSVAGNEIVSSSADTPEQQFVDTALSGTRLYVAVAGSTNGISARNPITLEEITAFDVPFTIDSIAAGDNDDLFIASGNEIFHFSTDGEELDAVAGVAGETFTDIAFLADARPIALGTIVAATTGVEPAVTSRNAETLAEAGSFSVEFEAEGIAVSESNEIYMVSGSTLLNLDADGVELNSMTEAGSTFSDVALVGPDLFVTTTGDGTSGISIRSTTSLEQLSFIATGFDPGSVAPGADGEIYLTSGSQVFRYSTSGNELEAFNSFDDREYTDVALINNVVFATYINGTNNNIQNAISILDPDTLAQIDVIVTDIAATGLTPGGANDYYISGGNTIQRLALDEVIATFTVDEGSLFPDVAFSQEEANSVIIVSATLPSSRSVQVGTSATAFATVINTGPVTATGCRISPRTDVPADFSYQATDPVTNGLVGMPDTPVDIALNVAQTFVFSFTPTEAFPATDVELDFQCINAAAAATTTNVNTLLLTANAAPEADVVALALTASNNGIVELPGEDGAGFFAVASINVGNDANLNVQAVLADPTTSVVVSICESNPVTAACINPVEPSVSPVALTIASGETPTFSIFVSATGPVPLDPANTRIQVQFIEQTNGEIRGATSVAVSTE